MSLVSAYLSVHTPRYCTLEAAFEGKLGLARTVFPYVENHNFYIEHWSMSVFWRKMRQLSRIFHEAGFWKDPDDLFYLTRQEVRDALFDYGNGWAIGVEPIGPSHWPALGLMRCLRRSRVRPLWCGWPHACSRPSASRTSTGRACASRRTSMPSFLPGSPVTCASRGARRRAPADRARPSRAR